MPLDQAQAGHILLVFPIAPAPTPNTKQTFPHLEARAQTCPEAWWPIQAYHPAGTSLRLTTVHQPPCSPDPPTISWPVSFWPYPCQTSLELRPRPGAWQSFPALTFSSPAFRTDAHHKHTQHQPAQGAHRKPATPVWLHRRQEAPTRTTPTHVWQLG